MSVWNTTTYKLDIAKEIYETIPNLMPKVLGRFIGDYLKPRGNLVDLDSTSEWDDVANLCDWEEDIADDESIEAVMRLTAHGKHWSIGVNAVYKLIHACYHGKFDVKDQYDYRVIDNRAYALGRMLSYTTLITPLEFVNKWRAVDRKLLELSRRFANFSEGWKYLARSVTFGKDEYTAFDQEKYFGGGSRIYYGGVIKNLVILAGSAEYKDRCLIMTKTHVDLIIEASVRISNLIDHVAREHINDLDTRDAVMAMLDLTIEASFKVRQVNSDKVVQAFHKGRAFMQMVLFQNVMENSRREALKEIQGKCLQTIIDYSTYFGIFTNLPRGRWLEVLHVYKWMPPPDYDPTYAFTELQELHTATRMSGLDYMASDRMVELWRLVERERKLNIAVAYFKINGIWPASLEIVSGHPTEAGLDSWVPKALFPYFTYGKDITAQIKDKSTVLSSLSDEIRVNRPDTDRNFLLWFLKHNGEVDTVEDARALLSGVFPEDNFSRVAYKGEAHKPGSRLFFMAPPRTRILLGELEGNISRVASHYPASLQGTAALAKDDRLERLFNIDDKSFVVDVMTEYTCYVVTFDLSKFSPKFNPAVLQNLHDFWADVFDYPPVKAMGALGSHGTILHKTCGLVMQYQNKGADLEGFRGRMMTLFHADLIAAACRLSVRRGHTVGKAQTAVFIDDGAVRIAARGKGEEAKENARLFLKCMQEVYEAAGQENHPNKTIVSAIGGELLSEQFLYGQKLKCPVKASMRLYTSQENPASCISEEFDALFSSAQGAVKDGGDWVAVYRRLADAYMFAINRWSRKNFGRLPDDYFAIKMITPKSLGGFGFPSLQTLTTTAAYCMTSEGLGMMNTISRSESYYFDLVKKVLDGEVVMRDPLQILRDPGRVRINRPVLIESRLQDKLLRVLSARQGPWSRLVTNFTDEELIEHARQVAISILKKEAVSFPVVSKFWDSTPLAFVEGIVQKFKRSSSVTAMVKNREISRIRKANMKDVTILLDKFVPEI